MASAWGMRQGSGETLGMCTIILDARPSYLSMWRSRLNSGIE